MISDAEGPLLRMKLDLLDSDSSAVFLMTAGVGAIDGSTASVV